MTKSIITILVVCGILVGGYYLTKRNVPENTESENTAEVLGESKKMAFADFIKQGGTYKCEVKEYLTDMDTSGTMYIAPGKVRGEFTTIVEGRSVDTSFLATDGYSYTWSGVMPGMGFKMKVTEDGKESGTYGFNPETIGDYDCVEWTPDNTTFAVPDLEFQEVNQN